MTAGEKYLATSRVTGLEGNALSMGITPNVVMKWTGHSDYSAMKPYIDIAQAEKSKAMAKFNKKK